MADLTLSDVVRHPVTMASALVSVLGGVLNAPVLAAVFDTVWLSAGKLFGVASLAAFTIAPEVAFLPESPLVAAALSLGAIVAVKKLRDVYKRFQTEL